MQATGIRFRRQGEPLETVRLNRQYMELLAQGDGTEVIRFVLQPGARFGLEPEAGWEAMECLTVVQGQLRWVRPDGDVHLEVGDALYGAPVSEQCNFVAEGPVLLLYVSSRPVFHLYSQVYAEFREMSVAVEEKDGYTAGHCLRVQELAARVGERVGVSPYQMHLLLQGAFLHDLGKVKVPAEILGKPGKLTPDEWQIVKQHAASGAELVQHTYLREIALILAQHHERYDGSGYPLGLRGDEISLEAQIVGLVDSFDAMTSQRPYHPGMPWQQAAAALRDDAGRLYRPDLVEALVAVLEQCSGQVEPGMK